MKPAPNKEAHITGTPEHPLCISLVIIFHTQWGKLVRSLLMPVVDD